MLSGYHFSPLSQTEYPRPQIFKISMRMPLEISAESMFFGQDNFHKKRSKRGILFCARINTSIWFVECTSTFLCLTRKMCFIFACSESGWLSKLMLEIESVRIFTS